MKESESTAVIATLNEILELELAGVVRYSHYSLIDLRACPAIPIVSDRSQATEALTHAVTAGEYVTALGGHPSLAIGKLLETHKHDIDQIPSARPWSTSWRASPLTRSTAQEQTEGKSVVLEEYARQMVHGEETHVMDIEKMLRRPGKLEPAR